MSIVRHEFGPAGVAYLREYLDSNEGFGRRLGPLLKVRELEAGTTSAFVPSHSSPQQRLDFAHGGLFSSDGKSWSNPALRRWIRDALAIRRSRPSLFCFEDALRRRRDAMPRTSSDSKVLFCGDDVYGYTATPEVAPDLMRPSATWTPSIAILTTTPEGSSDLHDGQSLGPEVLRAMTNAAFGVIVGAWDMEGWLIWEPATDNTMRSAGNQQFADIQV